MRNRPAAGEKQPSPLLAARHQRFVALVKNKDCQLGYSEQARKGLATRTFAVSLGNVADRRLSKTGFGPIPGLSLSLALQARELRKRPRS
jgi:hypothetical protein